MLVFLNCIRAGINFTKIPVQSDRGHQRGAQIILKEMGFCVSLKFCIYHIKLNVIDKFKNDDVDINIVEHVLIKLQRASNVQEYSHVLQEIREKCDIIYDYIMTIHPTSYSVFGNKSLTNEEKELIDSVWADCDSFGSPLPLHGWSANTATEGEHNAMNHDDTRILLPYAALIATIHRCNKRILRLAETAATAIKHNDHLFQPACKFRDREVAKAGGYVVNRTTDKNVYSVCKAGSEGIYQTHNVHVLNHTCSHCVDSQQHGMICRHQLAVLRYLTETSGPRREDWDEICSISGHFHPAYSTHKAQRITSVTLPGTSELIPDLRVLPSPSYKQCGRRKGWKKDRKKVQHRLRNKGEVKSSSYSKLPESPNVEDSNFKCFIDTLFPGTSKKQRISYKCSRCGQEGHNSRKCISEVESFDSTEIVAGKYVVNECPFEAYGKLDEYKCLLGGRKLEVGQKEEVVRVVAQICDEEVNEVEEVIEDEEVIEVEEDTQILWAVLDKNKNVRVRIRVSGDLSILTIQRFVRSSKLYEGMIKKLGGTRGKISPKLSSTMRTC